MSKQNIEDDEEFRFIDLHDEEDDFVDRTPFWVDVNDLVLNDWFCEVLNAHGILPEDRVGGLCFPISGREENESFTAFASFSEGSKVTLRIEYPFCAQTAAVPFVALHVTKYNNASSRGQMDFTPEFGNLYMKTSYVVSDKTETAANRIWNELMKLKDEAERAYPKLYDVARCRLDKEIKEFYGYLFAKSITALEGEAVNPAYGTNPLQQKLDREMGVKPDKFVNLMHLPDSDEDTELPFN